MSADGETASGDDAREGHADWGVGSDAFFDDGLEVGELERFLVLDWVGDGA